MLLHRVISSTVIVAALLAAALWLPEGGLVAVVMVIGMLGAHEFTQLARAGGMKTEAGLTVAGVGCYLGVLGWVALEAGPGAAMEGASAVLALWFGLLCARVMLRGDASALSAVGAAAAAACYTGVLLGYMLLLMEWGGRYLPLYMILVVKTTDTAAYLIGSAVGRRKAFPRISPGKTWEGCLGGVAAAVTVSVATAAATGGSIGSVHVPLIHAAVLGGLLAIIAIVGDLVESMFKRAARQKDSGSWIRGMGGVLDVIDSLLFASPLLYGYVRWLPG